MTLPHHPCAQILVVDRANRDDASPTPVFWFAGDIASADEVVECERSVTAASIVLAGSILTSLACLEGVHAGKPDALTADHDRVAVDHGGLADNGLCS